MPERRRRMIGCRLAGLFLAGLCVAGSVCAADTGMRQEAAELTDKGWHYVAIGEVEVALKRFRQATLIDPDYAPAQLGVGTLYLLQKRHSLAIQYLERALELDSANPETYLGLSGCYCALQQSELARKYLEQAVQLGARPNPALRAMLNSQCSDGQP